MQRLQAILSAFRYFFLFRRPYFSQLDFIDLIIDNKAIFLIAWQIKRGHKIQIKPISKSHRRKEGALLLQIPSEIHSVEIIASNIWRKTRKTIYLKHTHFDDVSSSSLIKQFKPVTTTYIKQKTVSVRNKLSRVKRIIPCIKSIKIRPVTTIKLKTEKFKYP
jgi:hypothetical protein